MAYGWHISYFNVPEMPNFPVRMMELHVVVTVVPYALAHDCIRASSGTIRTVIYLVSLSFTQSFQRQQLCFSNAKISRCLAEKKARCNSRNNLLPGENFTANYTSRMKRNKLNILCLENDRHFADEILKWIILNKLWFDPGFVKVCSWWSRWQSAKTDTNNSLASKRRSTII